MITTCTLDTYTQTAIDKGNKRKEAEKEAQSRCIIESPPAGQFSNNYLVLKVDGKPYLLNARHFLFAAKSAANCCGGVVQVRVRLSVFKSVPKTYDEMNKLVPHEKKHIVVSSTGKPIYVQVWPVSEDSVFSQPYTIIAVDAVETAVQNVQRR